MNPSIVTTVVPFALFVSVSIAGAQSPTTPTTTPARSGVVSAVLPGGASISGAQITVTPIAGGAAMMAPIAANGAFALSGLAPGRYRVALIAIVARKQTQGSTFGEKVNAGLHAAGSTAGSKVNPNNSMPSRLSMNVTIARQSHVLEVDGPAVEVEVGADGRLTGLITPK